MFHVEKWSPRWLPVSCCAGPVLMGMVCLVEHFFLLVSGHGEVGGAVSGRSPGLRHPLRLLPKGLHALPRQ